MTFGYYNGPGRMPRNNYKGKYVTHTSITRNWYSKPTPSDIQFEERELGIRATYTADALYEWNIDGLSEYEILNVFHEMMMVANVYKGANRSDHQVASSLITDSLEHLKCHTLTDFRWYKDVFLSRVLIKTDNRAPYWKEKFIGGLPKYFAHKVREKLNNDGHNDYTSLTYGEIINAIKHI
jgi:hypothetical protein